MSSASSARSAANAWITSSSSTRVTCGASSRGIFNIITGPGHICHSTRIVRSLAAYSLPLQATSSRSPRWAVCIIATNVVRHDRRTRFGVKDRRILRPLCSHARVPRISIHFAPAADVPDLLTGPGNTYSTVGRRRFPTSNTFLSTDRGHPCARLARHQPTLQLSRNLRSHRRKANSTKFSSHMARPNRSDPNECGVSTASRRSRRGQVGWRTKV
jgi:hypothetical protein